MTQAQHPAVTTDLLTIDPRTFVAETYKPFRERLDNAIMAAPLDVPDVTNKDGMKLAKEHRKAFSEIRIELEKKRAAAKAPILEISRLLDGSAKELAKLIEPHEERFDDAIKKEEARIAAEKEAAAKAEGERQARLQAGIDEIRNAPARAANMTAEESARLMAEISTMSIGEELFQERAAEALYVRDQAMTQLKSLVDGKRAQEELMRQQEAARLEAERVAREEAKKREEEEAARRAELKRQEEELRAQQAAIAAQQAEMERQRQELAAREEAQRKAEEAEKMRKEQATLAEREERMRRIAAIQYQLTQVKDMETAHEAADALDDMQPTESSYGDLYDAAMEAWRETVLKLDAMLPALREQEKAAKEAKEQAAKAQTDAESHNHALPPEETPYTPIIAVPAKILELAREMAQWHIQDNDECGSTARELLRMLDALEQ